jgi:hypothetical protein
MAIDLSNLAQCSDTDFLKILFSSGDFFPGFYRFSLGTRVVEKHQLTPNSLVTNYIQQEATSTFRTRHEWLKLAQTKIESLDYRNASRNNDEIYQVIDDAYKKWMLTAKIYDIAILDPETKISELELNTTYFFMGSLVRFTETSVKIGFDSLRDQWLYETRVDVNKLIEQIANIYKDDLPILFFPADIVAALSFDDSDLGSIHMTDDTIMRLAFSSGSGILVASNRDTSADLPIRWAKDILLSGE